MVPGEWWDVVIVGAGPAGCAAAMRVRQNDAGARVLLLDRAAFPRDKVCGDGVAAQVFHTLAELGLDRSKLTSGYPPRQRLRLTSPGMETVERSMRDEVFVIPRRVFDARLVAAAQAHGAVLRQHQVRVVRESDDSVAVDDSIRCGVLIGADGVESTVRRAIGIAANGVGHLAVAIRGYAPELTGQDGAQIITMAAAHWPAYAWSFPLGDGRANVGYGEVIAAQPVNRATLLMRMHDLLPGLGEPTEMRGHRLPLSTSRPRARSGRVLLVGDAQSLVNPLSGEGIYYAIRSGMAAGDAAPAGAAAGELYGRLLGRRLGRHLRHTSALAGLTRWPRLLDAGVRAARRNQGAFDDLVDLALADGLITGRLVKNLH